jgi:hypothetical protein
LEEKPAPALESRYIEPAFAGGSVSLRLRTEINVSNVQATAGPLLRLAQLAVVVGFATTDAAHAIRLKPQWPARLRYWRSNGFEYHC